MIFGVAAQFGFDLKDAVSIAIIGVAGISALPMSVCVVHKLGLQEGNQNFLLMHFIDVNVSGQIAFVIVDGLILNLLD